ncbi:MAG: hypothetical protein O6951_03355 [Actinobacteria bacterium]|nr:hypothetical protein [Actinomycetota bacterium]
MKQHSFDGVSFVSGIFIAAIGLLFLIPDTPSDIIHAFTRLGSWFWPIVLLVVAGAILLPIILTRSDTSDEDDQSAITG